MKITEVGERSSSLIQQLLEIREASARATHLFLSNGEVEMIKTYVPQAPTRIPHPVIVEDDNESPAAFMGMDGQKLEMPFVSGEERGNGLGRWLIQYGIEIYFVNELAANGQDPPAGGFYEHIGPHAYHRTELDEQGNPYPLLYTRYDKR